MNNPERSVKASLRKRGEGSKVREPQRLKLPTLSGLKRASLSPMTAHDKNVLIIVIGDCILDAEDLRDQLEEGTQWHLAVTRATKNLREGLDALTA